MKRTLTGVSNAAQAPPARPILEPCWCTHVIAEHTVAGCAFCDCERYQVLYKELEFHDPPRTWADRVEIRRLELIGRRSGTSACTCELFGFCQVCRG